MKISKRRKKDLLTPAEISSDEGKTKEAFSEKGTEFPINKRNEA